MTARLARHAGSTRDPAPAGSVAAPAVRLSWTRLRMAIGVAAVALSSLGLLGYALRQNRNTPMQPDASLAADPKPAPIDGRRAFGYLKQICDIGPRPAGSPANTRQRELVAEHFRKLGAEVREQKFDGRDPISGRPVAMANLVASWFPDRAERIVIAAHYDTRPHPDQETDPTLRRKPFLGANDGASGVALLMEIAHHLDETATPWGVDLVLFDGEELVYVDDFGRTIGEYFLGSKEFARRYQASRRTSRGRSSYVAGILLDMVGGKELDLPREPHSVQFAGGLVRQVWEVARKIGATAFHEDLGRAALDDHLALNDVGIPTIDIIDFEYPHWHLASDLPEQCAPESLEQVGRVVTAWLSLPKPQPQRERRGR